MSLGPVSTLPGSLLVVIIGDESYCALTVAEETRQQSEEMQHTAVRGDTHHGAGMTGK